MRMVVMGGGVEEGEGGLEGMTRFSVWEVGG